MATIPLTSKSILSTTFINAFDICNGRLTLTTNVPVTTSDVTAATTVYWTPYKGSYVAIYNGTQWLTYQFSQLSLALTGTTNCIDIFVSISGGVPVLSLLAWTNSTTRATALVLQNGVYVLSGTSTKRYLGTIYMNGSSQTSDAVAGRYVWNYYNRIYRPMRIVYVNGGWVVPATAYRQANSTSTNQLNFVVGLIEDPVVAYIGLQAYGATGNQLYISFGLNSTSTPTTTALTAGGGINSSGGVINQLCATFNDFVSIGLNYIAWLEFASATMQVSLGNTATADGMIGYLYG